MGSSGRHTVETRRGCYVAVFHLAAPHTIRIAKLGRFRFPKGFYLYVGSAQGGLEARLRRHGRRRKTPRWHVDYLSSHARMIAAAQIDGPKERECDMASKLAETLERPVPGFGSSDCDCMTHLFYTPSFPKLDSLGLDFEQ